MIMRITLLLLSILLSTSLFSQLPKGLLPAKKETTATKAKISKMTMQDQFEQKTIRSKERQVLQKATQNKQKVAISKELPVLKSKKKTPQRTWWIKPRKH